MRHESYSTTLPVLFLFLPQFTERILYFNPQNEQLWIIDYRIYDPDTDKKTKIDHVEEMMLNAINNKKIPFKTVLMDGWYATQRLMGLIDNLGKIYYCPLKSNRAR